MLQVLPALLATYDVAAVLHLVSPPAESAAPDRARLESWSRRDAAEIAAPHRLTFSDPGAQPTAAMQANALKAMRAAQASGTSPQVLAQWLQISTAMWSGNEYALNNSPRVSAKEISAALAEGDALRVQYGHYLGGMIYFEGEWYWAIDRLHHLEARWHAMGLASAAGCPALFPAPALRLAAHEKPSAPASLNFFCSLRSPYTYIALARIEQLVTHYGAELRLRFVLPMVMRGLPVPKEKRAYITLDVKREAEVLGLPFGRISDPVGAPTERGLAVLHRAIGVGKGTDFLRAFMRAVWSEGVDAGTDNGMQRIAGRAGLNARFVADALADESWRGVAQSNREEMLAAGLWGVPSFRINNGPARWGQDRLWLVERDLIELTRTGATQ